MCSARCDSWSDPPPEAATTFLNVPARTPAHPSLSFGEGVVRELPVQMPPMRIQRRGGTLREIFWFLVAFAAMFGAALLGLDLLI